MLAKMAIFMSWTKILIFICIVHIETFILLIKMVEEACHKRKFT
jgi:hypothetical protein